MLSTTFSKAVWLFMAINFGLDSTRVLPNWSSNLTMAETLGLDPALLA